MAKFNITLVSSRAYEVDNVETIEEATTEAYRMLEEDLLFESEHNALHNAYEVTDSFEIDEDNAEEEEK